MSVLDSNDNNQIENEMLSLGVYALVVRGHGQDVLMGKHVAHYLPLPGLEKLLFNFIRDLDVAFKYIYSSDVQSFLRTLQEKFQLDFIQLKSNLEENITNMKVVESDEIMIWYLVITKTLEIMREQVFEKHGWQILEKFYKEIKKSPVNSHVKAVLLKLDEQGNEELSLFYNLIFVDFLTQIYGHFDFQAKIQQLIREKLQILFARSEFK